jgi:hypothetical protein
MAPLIPNIGVGCSSIVSVTPRQLYPWYLLNRKVGVPQSWSRRCGEERILLPLLGLEIWLVQPVAQLL